MPMSCLKTLLAFSLLAAVAATMAAPGDAAAQSREPVRPPGAGFAERIEVELVTVDVWVVDRQGNPATGLGADSFQVLHDGQPVPLTHFAEVRAGARMPESGAARPPAEVAADEVPNHLILYFDRTRLSPPSYKPLVRSLREFVAAEGIEPERVLVLRQDRTLAVEAPFGSSREQLERALERLGKGSAGGLDFESELQLALDSVRRAWERNQDSLGSALTGISSIPATPGAGAVPGESAGGAPSAVVGGFGSAAGLGAGPDACRSFIRQVRPVLDSWTRSLGQRVAVTLANLSDAVSFLAGLPGVKTLLYLSDGLDTRPGMALATYASGLCPGAGAELLTGTLEHELTASFVELTRHANTNRVTINSLQASGLRSGIGDASTGSHARNEAPGSRSGFESTQRAGEQDGLALIAAETGGRTVFNQNEFGPALRRIGEDARTYYSLAYQPPASGEGGRRNHRIEIRLSDRTLTARYRQGYREKDRSQWLGERLEGALNLGISSNPLGVRLGAGTTRAGEEGLLVLPLHVLLPADRLAFLPGGETFVVEILVSVLARDVATDVLASREQVFRVKGAPGASGWADLTVELQLGEGTWLTAVAVQDIATRESSFVSTTVQVEPGN